MDLHDTISYDKELNKIYFCADDLYGYYTMPEMFDLVRSMVSRLESIMKEMKDKK